MIGYEFLVKCRQLRTLEYCVSFGLWFATTRDWMGHISHEDQQ